AKIPGLTALLAVIVFLFRFRLFIRFFLSLFLLLAGLGVVRLVVSAGRCVIVEVSAISGRIANPAIASGRPARFLRRHLRLVVRLPGRAGSCYGASRELAWPARGGNLWAPVVLGCEQLPVLA